MTPRRTGRVAGLILAAGSGSRMGGRSKLLLPVNGRPLVRWVAMAALDGGLDPVLAVVGHRARELSEALEGLAVLVVRNPDWRSGQGTSLAAGLRKLAGLEDVVAAAVLLGDEPEVRPAVIRKVVEAWRLAHRPIVRAFYRDRPGHPVVLARAAFIELGGLAADRGALSGRAARSDLVQPLRLDLRAPRDVDEPRDYRALRSRGLGRDDPEP